MSSTASLNTLPRDSHSRLHWGWTTSLVLYACFAGIVFLVQGPRPLLGPDHITYFQLADSILENRPGGDYWREADSVRSFGVLLAYMHAWTGSHILSMKVILAVVTVAYLALAELFFGLFATSRWQSVLFAVLSAFAVSFGVSSWGMTDSTALLSRSLAMPVVMLSVWLWFRFYDSVWKYLAFSVLVLGSLLHLSTFYVLGILGLLELWDFVAVRKLRLDRQLVGAIGGMVIAAILLYALEAMHLSVGLIHATIPHLFSAPTVTVSVTSPETAATEIAIPGDIPRATAPNMLSPATQAASTVAKPITAHDAWQIELNLRPWRNMPLRFANLANILSSVALILLLALVGMWKRRSEGFTMMDRSMAVMFVAIPLFALLPQTLLWVLRSFTNIYPATLEEVRAIGFIMIPALYFVLRLFQHLVRQQSYVKAAAIAVGVLVLPLTTKSLPVSARETIYSAMTAVHAVDSNSPSSVANARSALGISHLTPLYYSTEGVIAWFRSSTPSGTRILTDRDELMLLRHHEIVGPRQVAAVPQRPGVELPDIAQVYFSMQEALASHDLHHVEELARKCGADYAVVPWPVQGAPYTDTYFSIVPVRNRSSD